MSRSRNAVLLILLCWALSSLGCSNNASDDGPDQAAETSTQNASAGNVAQVAQGDTQEQELIEKKKEEVPPLLSPRSEAMNQKAPATFKAKFETSKGDFVLEVHRDWAPNGADRFYNLVNAGFFDGCRFFRVIDNFMAQFGLNGDPKVSAAWRGANIQDDPVKQSNTRGYVSYAMAGPNTRTTQLFINYKDNSRLDGGGFSPFAKVVDGMDVVDNLYSAYGENPRDTQARLQAEGNAYLEKTFPKLDYIKKASVIE